MEAAAAARAARLLEIDQLIEEGRVRHLWFLRRDYCPRTDEERLRALDYIQRYGDRDSFRRAVELTRWLSHPSSAGSAAS